MTWHPVGMMWCPSCDVMWRDGDMCWICGAAGAKKVTWSVPSGAHRHDTDRDDVIVAGERVSIR